MRTIIAFLLAATLSAFAQTSVITGTVKAPDGTPWQTEIQFLSKTTPIGLGGNLIPTKLTARTATNGTFSQSLFPGSYQTTIKGAPGASGWPDSVFYIYVTTNLGTYDITALMTNAIALPAHVLLTKGSIYVWNGTNVVGLAAGGNGTSLQADDTTATGLKWAAAAGSGTVTSIAVTNSGYGLTSSGGPITAAGTITLTLHTNLQQWSGVLTSAVVYPSQLGTAAYSNSTVFQPAGSYQPASANLTNWSGVAVADYPTRADIGSSNYVTASITNGLAHTNWLPVVIAGSNATVVTNIVGGQAQYTVSSTATGSGGGNNFNPNQFETNGASQVQFKSGAVITNLDALSPALKFTIAPGGPLTIQENVNGIGFMDGITELFNVNNTNCYFTQPLFVPTPTEDLHAATKAYVDANSGGTTNFPQIAVTNAADLLTNAPLRLYGEGYGDPSNYKIGKIAQGANSLDIGAYALGTGASTSNGMALNLATWGTNRLTIDPRGFVGIGTNAPTVPLQVHGAITAASNITAQGGVVIGTLAGGSKGISDSTSAADGVIFNGATSLTLNNRGFVSIVGDSNGNDNATNDVVRISAGAFARTTYRVNGLIQHGTGAVAGNLTNVTVVFDTAQGTNWLGGTTTITNLGFIGSVPTATKSITNTWYSRTADNSAAVTNVQIYINGVLTSWTQNGSEL